MDNPFEFGRELSAGELVDRTAELRQVRDTLRSGAKLFLIGPRRFGKTSLLHAASEQVARGGVVVLRYDAQAFPSLELLAGRLAADAAQRLTRTVDKAGAAIKTFFAGVRPSATFDATEHKWSLTLAGSPGRESGPPLFADVLDGVERAAAASGKKVAVVIDEFQEIVEAGGVAAEEQIRAAIQRHRHVAYVFAGSRTRMLADMVKDANRPFHRLGTPLFLGAIPREEFAPFLAKGFRGARIPIEDGAVTAILDAAEDVPYNVQLLAHACWTACRTNARGSAGARLTTALVADVVRAEAMRHDPLYTQLWSSLTSTQRRALLAVRAESGVNLASSAVALRSGMPVSTLQRALQALESKQIVREEPERGTVRLRLEDPLFGAWIGLVVKE
jgi:AAA+ ATPase superfamily predicted ATPase